MLVKNMSFTDIIVEKKKKIVWITLNKPNVRNAMGKQTLIEIATAIEGAEKDPDAIAVVVRGAGNTFCSGMDTRENPQPDGQNVSEFTVLADRMFLSIAKMKKVSIAVVEGYCMAGGFELALVCDLIFADENCRMGDGHINLPGFVPNGGSSIRLPRLIGKRKAKEILFTGELISGKEAERIGLVNRAFPSEDLQKSVEGFVSRLADKSPIGLEYMKKLIDRSTECTLEAGLIMERMAVNYLGGTEDRKEAMAAFKEKRAPVYKGR
ncbi:MAG: enoyl-CoA hydratase/isomerase family protein [Deltaproteobacteria bacterium]|nr:enoyl-CoA hydratase/isomerase family protein [Deltaproteobacteria bacterium]